MNHIKAFLLKITLISAILFSILNVLYDAMSSVFILSLIIAVAGYLIGDLFILPKFGDSPAVIADFLLCLGVILGFGLIVIDRSFVFITIAFLAAFLIAVTEAFFHYYIHNQVLEERQDIYEDVESRFATEFSKEEDIHQLKISQNQKSE